MFDLFSCQLSGTDHTGSVVISLCEIRHEDRTFTVTGKVLTNTDVASMLDHVTRLQLRDLSACGLPVAYVATYSPNMLYMHPKK